MGADLCLCGGRVVNDEAATRRLAVALAATGPVGGADPGRACSSPPVVPGCAVAVDYALPGAERQYAGRNDRISL